MANQPWLDFGAASSAATSSPFENNAYLVVGSSPSVSGGGVSGVESSASPTSTASIGSTPSGGYGVTAQPLTSSVGNLLNNSTFWLAVAGLAAVLVILKRKK